MALALEWWRCPDGLELVDRGPGPAGGTVLTGPSGGLWVWPRSERKVPVSYAHVDLENPIVLHFINAKDQDEWIRFLNRFGLLEAGYGADSLRSVADLHERLLTSVRDGLTGDAKTRSAAVNALLRDVWLSPTLDSSASGAQQLSLTARNLRQFMCLEVAMASANNAEVTSCENCSRLFFTGPLTGRRSHAKYCSDRCRVAAMRKRNASKAAS